MPARYCFRCPSYGCPGTMTTSLEPPHCDHGPMTRDYRAEGVSVSGAVSALKAEREGAGLDEVKRLMLPSNKDFVGPGDPDGTKGMRQWRDDHQPKAGNTRPSWPGEVERKVF